MHADGTLDSCLGKYSIFHSYKIKFGEKSEILYEWNDVFYSDKALWLNAVARSFNVLEMNNCMYALCALPKNLLAQLMYDKAVVEYRDGANTRKDTKFLRKTVRTLRIHANLAPDVEPVSSEDDSSDDLSDDDHSGHFPIFQPFFQHQRNQETVEAPHNDVRVQHQENQGAMEAQDDDAAWRRWAEANVRDFIASAGVANNESDVGTSQRSAFHPYAVQGRASSAHSSGASRETEANWPSRYHSGSRVQSVHVWPSVRRSPRFHSTPSTLQAATTSHAPSTSRTQSDAEQPSTSSSSWLHDPRLSSTGYRVAQQVQDQQNVYNEGGENQENQAQQASVNMYDIFTPCMNLHAISDAVGAGYNDKYAPNKVNLNDIERCSPTFLHRMLEGSLTTQDLSIFRVLAKSDRVPLHQLRGVVGTGGVNNTYSFFFLYDTSACTEIRQVACLFLSVAKCLTQDLLGHVRTRPICCEARFNGYIPTRILTDLLVRESLALGGMQLRTRRIPLDALWSSNDLLRRYSLCRYLLPLFEARRVNLLQPRRSP